ncbi:MAG: archaemetzincin family Zn-dependent metalloprotease [Desulfovermiculus sp.]
MHAQILVTSIHNPPSSILHPVCEAVHEAFGLPASSAPLLQGIEFAYHFSRNQYHSTSILQALDQAAPEDCSKILAIAEVDLFIPILTHVYGEAQMGGRAAMISTYRLGDGLPAKSSGEVFLQRVIKEALHELGHTFYLKHCPDQTCIMHYCRSIKDVDHKTLTFCRYCRIMLDEEIARLTDH